MKTQEKKTPRVQYGRNELAKTPRIQAVGENPGKGKGTRDRGAGRPKSRYQ